MASKARSANNHFFNVCKDCMQGFILDIGGSRKGKSLGIVPKAKWNDLVTTDIVVSDHVDVIMDATYICFKENSVDTVLSSQMLEHCCEPYLICEEIRRVLKPNGQLLLCVAFNYPIHYPKGGADYFRFTPQGLKYLMRNFNQVRIHLYGPENYPDAIGAIATK
jgi:SAM-dependent methyltransferase